MNPIENLWRKVPEIGQLIGYANGEKKSRREDDPMLTLHTNGYICVQLKVTALLLLDFVCSCNACLAALAAYNYNT